MLVVKRNDADDYYIQNCHLPQAVILHTFICFYNYYIYIVK